MFLFLAEKDCVAKGGYLFHISNQQEQDFILQFINSKSFAHACWMGLNDLIMEESFDWISGKFAGSAILAGIIGQLSHVVALILSA